MGSSYQNKKYQRYGGRPSQIRRTLPIVTIVCDDTKTAVAYFNEIKRREKEKVTIKVEPAPRGGATPEMVYNYAYHLIKSNEPKEPEDSTWVLIDTEVEKDKEVQALKVKNKSTATKINVLLSKPCYEIWTLAHLTDTGETFGNCNAILTRIKSEWKKKFKQNFSNKSQADYTKLMPLQLDAIKNAKKRNPKRDGSWTEVYLVVEAILQLIGGKLP